MRQAFMRQNGANFHAWIMQAMLVIALLLACMPWLHAADQVPVPALAAQVTDQIGMLDPTQRATLEGTLRGYAERTGTQIGILLIATTEPEAIEQYGIRVAEAWKLGRKNIDDGVILIVARDNPPSLRRLRLEVGRGVQGTLTDAQSNRILQDVIAPHFRQKDYYGGLVAATTALQTLLDQEHLPAPPSAPATSQRSTASNDVSLADLLPILVILMVGIAMVRSRIHGGGGLSSNGWGRTAGVIIGSQIGNAIGRSGGFGGGGGGGFGGGGGGGGFSGGGGGFDGGGASGNW